MILFLVQYIVISIKLTFTFFSYPRGNHVCQFGAKLCIY